MNFFTNGYDTLTKGIDAVVSYNTAIGPGQFAATAAQNHNDTEVTHADAGVISVQTSTASRLGGNAAQNQRVGN